MTGVTKLALLTSLGVTFVGSVMSGLNELSEILMIIGYGMLFAAIFVRRW
jgi:uncharacterized membrane protein YdfJ with MMPL/SSD domain